MGLRRLMQLLLGARRSTARSEHAIEGAISEVKHQQDIAQRLRKLDMDLKARHK